MKLFNLLVLGAGPVAAISGKATTTRYWDGQMGACGCGTGNTAPFSWQQNIGSGIYTAAASAAIFGSGSWCGSGCGQCFNLTSTGQPPCSSCGAGGASGQSIIVMVTNLCPYAGNEKWCPNSGGSNQYGFNYHFDIMAQSQVFGDNPVVNFESISCPGQAASDWGQCQCAKGGH